MTENQQYIEDVRAIKFAILASQASATRFTNEKMLVLYAGVGKYISSHSRTGQWGKGAIEEISRQLRNELPGLRGFSPSNLKNMRYFYEEWFEREDSPFTLNSPVATGEFEGLQIGLINRQSQLANSYPQINDEFLRIGFTHHICILSRVSLLEERMFYIHEAAENHFSVATLKRAIAEDDYAHRGTLPNNFLATLAPEDRAMRAVMAFKDEYLLDFINVEQYGVRDKDIDERMLEQGIIHNIKDFILEFGKDMAFVGNQYRIEALGEEQYIDLLFFSRELNCLVAVELKSGPFKAAYLGQLSGYLSLLDEFVKKQHEAPSIGIVLCKDVNRAFVDLVIRDYANPMGVASYKTTTDVPKRVQEALPSLESLRKFLEEGNARG